MLDDRQLAQMLTRKGLATEETLQRGRALSEEKGKPLYDVLLEHDLVNEERLIVAVSKLLNLPCVSLKEFEADESILQFVAPEIARRFNLVPLGLTEEDGENKLFVAMGNPLDLDALDEVQRASGYRPVPLLAGLLDVRRAIGRVYADIEVGEIELEPIDMDLQTTDDDGLGEMLDGVLAGGISRLMDEDEDASAPEAPVSSGASTPMPSLKLPELGGSARLKSKPFSLGASRGGDAAARANDKGSKDDDASDKNDKKANPRDAFSLDFGDLDLSVSTDPPRDDPHSRQTLPAGVEIPSEVRSQVLEIPPRPAAPSEAESATPEPASMKADESAPGQGGMTFDNVDWGLDFEEEEVDGDTSSPGRNDNSNLPRHQPRQGNDRGTIRYVVDPNLSRQTARFPDNVPATDLIRAVVKLLINKGVLTEDEIKNELRRQRNPRQPRRGR